MAVVDQLVALLSYKVEGEADLKRFQKSLDALEKQARSFGSKVGIGITAAAAGIAAAMGALAGAVVKTNAEFETFEATLTTIEGSSTKAKQSMAWISEFARRTPYEVAGITAAFVKLKAYGIDPTDGTLKVLGDTASAMGKTLDQAVEAFADASTGQYERLREFGITTATKGDQVTLSWVKNGEKLSKTMKKTGTDVSDFLKDLFGQKFGGAMEARMNTWAGMMANLADAWTDFKRSIGDAGFFETMKKHLKSVLDLIDRWNKDGTLEAVAKGFSYAFEIAADAVAYAFGRISRAVEWIIKNWARIGPIVKSSAIAFGVLLAAMSPLRLVIGGVIAAMTLLIDDFLTYLRGGDSLIGEFFKIFPKFEQSLKDLFTGLGGTGLFGDPLKDLRELYDLLSNLGKKVGEWGNQWNALKEKWAADFLDLGKSIVDWLIEGMSSFGTKFSTWLVQKFRDAFTALYGGTGTVPPEANPHVFGGSYSGGGGTGGLIHRASISSTGGGTDGGSGTTAGSAASYGGSRGGTGGTVGGTTADIGSRLKGDLMRDFGLSAGAASGVVGSLAHESGGFKQLQELKPVVAGSKGGYGFAQWTGPRRRQYFAWCAKNGLNPASYEANYGFLKHELQNTSEGRWIKNLPDDPSQAAAAFTGSAASRRGFLRPGIVHGASRGKWARRFGGMEGKPSGTASADGGDQSAAYKQFRGNYDKVDGAAAGATINTDRSNRNSMISVQAPVSVHVANADSAPAATARAVGRAVDRGARTAAAPSRMQASPAA